MKEFGKFKRAQSRALFYRWLIRTMTALGSVSAFVAVVVVVLDQFVELNLFWWKWIALGGCVSVISLYYSDWRLKAAADRAAYWEQKVMEKQG